MLRSPSAGGVAQRDDDVTSADWPKQKQSADELRSVALLASDVIGASGQGCAADEVVLQIEDEPAAYTPTPAAPCPECQKPAEQIGEDTMGRPYFWCAACGVEFQSEALP